jgi:hypothetical protein
MNKDQISNNTVNHDKDNSLGLNSSPKSSLAIPDSQNSPNASVSKIAKDVNSDAVRENNERVNQLNLERNYG